MASNQSLIPNTSIQKTANNSSRWSSVATAAILVLFAGARLWRLTSSCLWFDEIFSVHAARHSWMELLRFAAADIIHPPLFYLLLKVWIALGGESLLWLRLLPALLSIAAIIPFLLLCREMQISLCERNLALVLLAVNGYLIKYAQELRMYSLLMFLSLTSLWLIVKLLKDNSSRNTWSWLFVVNLLLVYSHYAGWLVVVSEAVVLIIWRRERVYSFLKLAALTIAAYLPWLYLVAQNKDTGKGLAQNIGWVRRPGLFDLTELYAVMNRPFWFVQSNASSARDLLTAGFAIVVLGVPLFLLVLSLRRVTNNNYEARSLRALSLFVLAPIALVFTLSWILPHSIWGTRHLIIVAAPYAILVAVAIAKVPRYGFRLTIYLVLAFWLVLAAIPWTLTKPSPFIWCAWDPLAAEVKANNLHANQIVQVYAFEDLVAYHLWFSFQSPPNDHYKVVVIKNLGIPEDTAYFLPRRFDQVSQQDIADLTAPEIWIAFRTARWDETAPPLSSLEKAGYHPTNAFSRQAQGQQAFMVRMNR